MHKTTSLVMLLIAVLLLSPVGSLAQSGSSPEFNITIDNVRPPTECKRSYWAITYDRTTTFSDLSTSTLTRYFVQYINNDPNLVHYWESGYNAYVQDYWVSAGTRMNERAKGSYTIPFWTDTYQAESIEYILQGDEVIWAIRATLTCEDGEVVAYDITSEPSQGTRDALPDIPQNLVVALEDIPLYGNPQTQTDYWGTIEACQTFFITDISIPRASILVWGRESITGHMMMLFDGSRHLPIVDVADNYGQPDGQPILEECGGEPALPSTSVDTAETSSPIPALTPDTDDRIAFDTQRDGNTEIYVMNADGSDPQNLTQNAAVDYFGSWSPDGNQIAFTTDRDGNDEIYIMNGDGTNPRNLTQNEATDHSPVWSPDGHHILFSSYRDNDYEIYVMDSNGENVRNLTQNEGEDGRFRWSPDGSRILFVSSRTGNWELYVMNADGSDLRQLTQNSASDDFPVWSPDGTQIAFTSAREGDLDIYVMDSSGENIRRLAGNSTANDGGAVWSPDGRQIAFWSERDGNSEIYVMNADGSGDPLRLTYYDDRDFYPVWSANSSQIAYVSMLGLGSEIFLINADGTDLRRLTNNDTVNSGPVWAPHATG